MKVLLINPNNAHVIKSNFPVDLDREGALFPPLGLLYIASFLKKRTYHAAEVLDMQAQNIGPGPLKNIIREKKPDIVGIYSTTFTLLDTLLTAKAIKETAPHIHISLGGPHVNIYPDESIANENIDSVVLGEGDIRFAELVDALEHRVGPAHIKGLLYKDKKRICKTGPPESIHNLDILPFPERTMVPYRRYHNILSHDSPSTTMISSRGCPHNCAFCYHAHLGRHVRFRGTENIAAEIEGCLTLGIKDIFFYDDTFVLDQQRVIDLCHAIAERNLKFKWGIRTRVDNINYELLSKLRKAGCRRIQFGVESGTPKVLSALKKGVSLEQVKKVFALTRKANIETMAYFMIGCPEEKTKDILETIDLAIRLNPDYAHFSITMPLPDTELYKSGLKKRLFKKDFWKEFATNPEAGFSPSYWEEYLSEEELCRLLKYAYRVFHFRPYYIFKTLLKSASLKDLRKRIRMGGKLLRYTCN